MKYSPGSSARFPAGRFDRVKGFPRLLGLAGECASSAACLHHDDADRVRDDVVELARDSDPFLRDGGAGPLLAFLFGRQRPSLEMPFAEPAMADRPTGQPRPTHHREEEQVSVQVGLVRVGGERPEDDRNGPEHTGDGLPAGGVRADGIDRDQYSDCDGERPVP
jgi:hypothetical protein